jgi:hypothetical protein
MRLATEIFFFYSIEKYEERLEARGGRVKGGENVVVRREIETYNKRASSLAIGWSKDAKT